MIDAVINHISRESEWFQGYLNGDPKYQNYFITVDSSWDLSKVVRPRTSPLLTEVETVNGPKKVWTTFSADQIDLNYANPAVLLEILDLLLFYLDQGVSIIRLDAIAYLWKESGTTCIHLPQTHRVVKLMRLVMEAAKPAAVLITETNVPHMENISYFGSYDYALKRTDEAHMVYQFPLAPLVLHTLVSGSAKRLMDWVEGLGSTGIFFNFIASHDGIGMLPAHGILTDEEIKDVIDQVSQHGGLLSHRSNPDGSMTVYELNTTLFDALNDPNNPDPTNDINRFLASQVIIM
jgi:sucrose phosphorylase